MKPGQSRAGDRWGVRQELRDGFHATWPTCWSPTSRYADPVALVFYKNVLVTKGAIEERQGAGRMSRINAANQKFDRGASVMSINYDVILSPVIISEKATRIDREVRIRFVFKRAPCDATKPAIAKAAVEPTCSRWKVQGGQHGDREGQASRRFARGKMGTSVRDHVKKAIVTPGSRATRSISSTGL